MHKSLLFFFLVSSLVGSAQNKAWKPFTSKVGAFSAVFPGDPKITTTSNRSPEGFSVTGLMHMIQEDEKVAYVIYNEMEAGVNILDDSLYLASSTAMVIDKFNTQPEFVKDIMFEGSPGKHFLVKFPDGIAEGKIILRTNRAYFVAAFYPTDQSADREKFLNSFHFLPYQERTWKAHTSKDHFFTVDFPTATPKVGEEQNEDGSLLYTYYGLDPLSGNNYSVAVEKYSPYATYKSDSAILAERTTWRYGDQIESDKDVTIGGRPARELVVNFGSDHFKMKLVTFTHGSLGYLIFAFLPESEMNDKTSNRFFNSFRFTGKPSGDLLSDKTDLILKDVVSHDTSTWYPALDAFVSHDFEEKDLPKIEKLVLGKYTDETDSSRNRKLSFLKMIGQLRSPASTQFIRNNHSNFKGNALLEKEALTALATINTVESNELLLELLKTHKPIRSANHRYYFLFAEYRLDSAYRKDFLMKAIPFVGEPAYKDGLYSLTRRLFTENRLSITELQPYKQTMLADFRQQSDRFLKDSVYSTLDDLLSIIGYDQLTKKEFDILTKLTKSHNDYIRIEALATLLRQKQKVDEKALRTLAADHYARVQMFSTFEQYSLLNHFPKQYLRQDSLAVSEMYNYMYDEYFEPSDIEVLHREIRDFGGKRKLFFVVKFQDPEEGNWYRGVCGPYDPDKLSLWGDSTGSDLEVWNGEKDHSEYLQNYLNDLE